MVGVRFEIAADGPDEPLEYAATACGAWQVNEISSPQPAYVALNADTRGIQLRHRVSLRQARLLAEALLKAADAAEQMPVEEYWKRTAPAPEAGG